MKVIEINILGSSGSTGRIVNGISKVLKVNGHEVIILYGYGKTDDGIKIVSRLGYFLHKIFATLTGKQGCFSVLQTRKVIKKIDKIKPDIVHMHNIHGNYINYKILFKYLKDKDIQVVWTLHDCWAFTGKCVYFDLIGCDKWKTCCENCPQLKEYPKSIIDSTYSQFFSKKKSICSLKNLTIVTPSIWLKDLVLQSYLSKYNVCVINNGINLDLFKPIQSNLRVKFSITNKFVILGVASEWTSRKGFSDFIKLSKMLNDECVIILIGLDAKVIKNLPSNIIGVERTESINQLCQFYTTANVLFNPTMEDNYPTVNLEAMACGTPIICYNTGGCIEQIPNICGRIINQNAVNDALSIIIDMQIGKIVFDKKDIVNYAKESFSETNSFTKYLELFENLI